MPLTHDIGVRIPYPLLKQTTSVVCFFFCCIAMYNMQSATIKSSFVFRLNIISSKLDDINQKKHKPPVSALHIPHHKILCSA